MGEDDQNQNILRNFSLSKLLFTKSSLKDSKNTGGGQGHFNFFQTEGDFCSADCLPKTAGDIYEFYKYKHSRVSYFLREKGHIYVTKVVAHICIK